jgi:hypothetical protein
VPCGKDLGIAHIDLLWIPDDDATNLRKVGAVFDLLEKVLHRLLWIPCLTYLLEIVLQIY